MRHIEVRLRGVCLRRAGRTILRDIDWVIAPGQRWALIGGNGAGKTQLLKLIAGSIWPTPPPRRAAARAAHARRRGARPTASRVYVFGGTHHATPRDVLQEIAYLGPERHDKYERYAWNSTAERVVGTGLHRTDIPLEPLTASERRRIGVLLRRLAIGHLAQRPLLELSYGERRLVLLARSLAGAPHLLLLDELLSGLDPLNHRRALDWLNATAHRRLPWVLATHRLQDLPASATHALVLERGRISYRGRIAAAPLARWLGAQADAGARARPRRAAPRRRASPRQASRGLVRLGRARVYLEGRRVLDGFDLELHSGQCWVVHGPNGAGKSTLLRLIYGEHGIAAGGRIERAGIGPGVPLEQFQRRVGLVAPHLQSRHPSGLSVCECVLSGRRASIGLAEPATAEDRRLMREALRLFGLTALARRPLCELSYGQMRRVLFARAWLARPVLWLLDEPFAGVDAPTRAALARRLEGLIGADNCIVIATHHREEWPRGCTHELELVAGRARYLGPVRRLRPLPAAVRGRSPMAVVPASLTP
ncbi:MAG TPA: ATP-binding cassette domain-containing protein [Steroidobacteraceae bacterium]|nr:ATP-binding cassette domain-containing protein [Steroidobacteraceae bacterium]